MAHELGLQLIEAITHDTNRLVFERPDGYDFKPGQATDLALQKEGWKDEARPFTFTSLPAQDTLEFVIKSYPDHDGVTEQIGKMSAGDRVVIEEPWGAISDQGAGTFIAGGAGVTPFIAILRSRMSEAGNLDGYRLILSNKSERDIILRREFEAMPGLEVDFLLSDEDVDGLHHGRVDGEFLDRKLPDFDGTFYLCGPPPMEDAVSELLKERGVTADRLIMEDE
ncbi:MAG: FAD-binding oxidoreductase [Erythrobacter sp.]